MSHAIPNTGRPAADGTCPAPRAGPLSGEHTRQVGEPGAPQALCHLPDEGGLTEELAELRELRIQQSKIADRLGRLEKRLRATLSVD